ncbi:MAG: hypothetical protein LBR16_01590 [Treponema sp.]|nr:hypothetical protein [Treponema sp.]
MQTIKASYNGEVFVPFSPVRFPKDQIVYITPADAEEAGDAETEHFNAETIAAMEDVLAGRDIYGPYKTAKEAVAAMLAD